MEDQVRIGQTARSLIDTSFVEASSALEVNGCLNWSYIIRVEIKFGYRARQSDF